MKLDVNSILQGIPDKQYRWKSTTSLKWKKDVLEFFLDKNIENCLEIGTNQGWSSYFLSYICTNVYTVEHNRNNYEKAKEHCNSRNNIHFILGDAYVDDTYKTLPLYLNLCIIDCIHTYEAVKKDIMRCLTYAEKGKDFYIVFDDYSHPESTGVKKAIDEFISFNPYVSIEKLIGQEKGHKVHRDNGTSFELIGPEGIILKYRYEK